MQPRFIALNLLLDQAPGQRVRRRLRVENPALLYRFLKGV